MNVSNLSDGMMISVMKLGDSFVKKRAQVSRFELKNFSLTLFSATTFSANLSLLQIFVTKIVQSTTTASFSVDVLKNIDTLKEVSLPLNVIYSSFNIS